ncbi:MAG: Ig-like domain-containing protein, partial [Desulfobacterales bacterium]|nr:Ig-like domain-containing protein [Desulfobacterales bacterium]
PETDSFTYTVTDSDGSPSTGTVTITIIDDVPQAFADSGTATEGGAITLAQSVSVLDNDTVGADAGGTVVGLAVGATGVDSTGTMSVAGQYGTLTIAADGHYSYVASGSVVAESQDVFTYTMQDADGDYSHATLTITFTGDSNAPTAYDDAKDIDESGLRADGTESVSGTVVFDPGLDIPATLTADLTTLQYGTATFNPLTGAWTYTLTSPVTDAAGPETDSFTYTVTDSDGSPSTGTVTITIIDDVPQAFADSGTTSAGQTLTVPQLTGVLANDTIGADVAGTVVGLAVGDTGVDSTGTMTVTGLHGTLTINTDGSYSYVANNVVSVESQDVFTYTMQDADGDLSHATLTIGFEGDNSVPYAYDDSKDINESGLLPDGTESVSGTVVFDPGLDVPATLTADLTTLQYGTATFDPLTGDWTYTLTAPVTDAAGPETDSFTYTVTDSDGSQSTGTVTITIIDDVPKAFADSGTTTEGGTLTMPQISGVLANDTLSADAAVLVVGLAAGNTGVDSTGTMTVTGLHGTLTINADGSYSYVADSSVDAESQDVFTYTIQDADGDYSHATLTIGFQGDNNMPAAFDDWQPIDESGLRVDGTESVSGTVSFVPGLDVPVTLAAYDSSLQYGTLSFDTTTGAWTYTLNAPVHHSSGPATDIFTYTVTDSDGSQSYGTITIVIMDDVPTAYADSGTTSEGQTITVPKVNGVLANDTIGADAAGEVVGLAAGDTGADSHSLGTVFGLHGVLMMAPDGSYKYEAYGSVDAGSQDVFSYTMQDGDGDYSHATLTITFQGDNNGPTAYDDSKDIAESGLRADGTESVSGTVVFDPGLDGPATLTADDSGLQYGTLNFDLATGDWTYTLTAPVTDAAGPETDSFTYTV